MGMEEPEAQADAARGQQEEPSDYSVRAFFNDALGGSVRPGANAESDRRREQTETSGALQHLPMIDGYFENDPLIESALGPISVTAATPEAAAEEVWRQLNADERPNGTFERSLSVGDVVIVQRGSDTLAFSFEMVGVRQLPHLPVRI